MEDGPKVRTNGFERPFHPLQVLSWAVFGSDVFVYIVFCLPLIDTVGAKVLVALFYISSVVILVLATVKATSCDPADPHVRLPDSELKAEDLETMPYCTMCNVPVFSRSKHCRACNKCVTVFDHHCMWLNNCIGGENYRAFFVTVSSVAVMIGIVLGTCLYLLIDYGINEDMFEDRAHSIAIYSSLPKEFFLGLLITMTALNTPLFLLDLQLVLLHAFLASQQLTTYEYIMNKRSQMDRPEGDKASGRIGRRIRTLPGCMDWIVFSRCGQKRRKKRTNSIERIETQAEPVDAEVGNTEPGARGAPRPMDTSPSPPGSTVDPTDDPGDSASGVGFQQAVGGQAQVSENSGQKTFENRDVTTPSHAEANGVLFISKAGCRRGTSTSRPCSTEPAISKL